MNKDTREKEIWLESQLVVVTAYTILTVALIGVTILLHWELWMIPLLAIALISVWTLHITQGMTERIRTYYYIVLILIEFFFYGVHPTSFFDLPILLILILLLFATIDETRALFMALLTYVLELVYHIAIIHTFRADSTDLDYSRIGLDIVAGLVGFLLTQYLVKRRRQEKNSYADVIEELKNTTRRAEDFLTNVSHELRTPINAVTGMSEVMLRNEGNPERRKDLLAIQQAGQRLFAQISDILDYTELDTGRIKISNEPYMISSTINDLITEMRFTENQPNLEFVIDISPQIPSMMIGDEGKIKKIIRHLADNSFKFTKQGGIYLQIFTLKKDYGVNLCIVVQDTGIGIESAKVNKLYERFYQVDAGRSRRTGGMGLGLSIVYGMVQEMGGFMYITGVKDKGTSVHISIPQEVADATPCMLLEKNERTCIAAYTQPKKYAVPVVREFYNLTIEHLRQGLGVDLHKTTTLGELQKIQNAYSLSHVFIGRDEYEEAPEYFEKLAESICVIVIASNDFTPKAEHSRIIVTNKPFNGFPLTNIIENGTKVYMKDVFFAEKRMVCPNIRALVVDDDEMNLLVASGILRDYQMEVTTALSGMAAISLCEDNSFDIIFLDHMMPEMDGVETMHRLKNLVRYSDENMVIIALTANAVSGAREMFLQEGFDEFIAKPIETTAFERVLRKILPSSAIQFIAKEAVKKDRYTEENTSATETDSSLQKNISSEIPHVLLDALRKIGINVKSGLAYCRDDIKFYVDLLKKFASDAQTKGEEIKSLYEDKNWETYKIKVHALKSAAKTVGMDEISKQAESLEKAVKKADIAYVQEHTAALLEQYDSFTKNTLSLFRTEAEDENKINSPETKTDSPAHASATPSLSEDDSLWRQKLAELKNALDAFESNKSETLVRELMEINHRGKSGAEWLSLVPEHIQNFDYQPAADIVSALLEETEGESK
ncbi:MAG: response regulator [Treponema sp.]|nr:response regulator [Treponema sp.]